MEIGRKSEGEEGFLILGRGVIWESFQGDGKVEEFKERFKRLRITGKGEVKDNRETVHDQATIYVIGSSRVGGAVEEGLA